jgi:polyhydroxybutyrate depolymerase
MTIELERPLPGPARNRLRSLRMLRSALVKRLVVAWLACFAAITCKGAMDEPRAGSETNFLKHCNGTCGDGLACLCGICTKACTGTNECSEFAENTQCVSIAASSDESAGFSCQRGATCDRSCIKSSDCQDLGAAHRCESGYCRQGALTCPELSLSPGEVDRSIDVNGTIRKYTMHVPTGYTGSKPVPLVLDFHPMGLGPDWERSNSGFRDLADQEQFIVIWPQGVQNTWDIGPCCAATSPVDDFAFVRAIIRRLSAEACVDTRRIYATGVSMGGSMAYYLACQQAEVFAAVAVSGMDMFAESEIGCAPSRPVSVISFRGTADTVVPYAGGPSSPPDRPNVVHDLLGAVGTFEKWAALNGCTGSPATTLKPGCSTYSRCNEGAEVTLCTVQDAGQEASDVPLAWSVLKQHPMP